MSDVEEYQSDYLKEWLENEAPFKPFFAPDGLMRLRADEPTVIYRQAEKTTVDNDNGILFMVTYLWLMLEQEFCYSSELPKAIKERLDKIIDSLATRPRRELGQAGEGLYDRSSERWQSLNSIDNYTAIVAGLTLAHNVSSIRAIIDYGERNGWIFNNVSPGKRVWGAWRQWSDRAFYKICAGLKPTLLERIWFTGSIYVQALQGKGRESETLLMFNWVKSLMYLNRTKPYQNAIDFWIRKLAEKGGISAIVNAYYNTDMNHPNRKLAMNVWF